MHKDRATALLLAIYLYRSYIQLVDPFDVMTAGGIVKDTNKSRDKRFFEATNPIAIGLNKSYHAFERANNILNQ